MGNESTKLAEGTPDPEPGPSPARHPTPQPARGAADVASPGLADRTVAQGDQGGTLSGPTPPEPVQSPTGVPTGVPTAALSGSPQPVHRLPESGMPDPLLADRQKYWRGFTKATQAAIIVVVVVLVLLAFFLL